MEAERVALRQLHLPVLSSTGVLAYDPEDGRVSEPHVPPLYARLYAGR